MSLQILYSLANAFKVTQTFCDTRFLSNGLVDKRTANIDTWTDFDGATAFDVNALLVATTLIVISFNLWTSGTTITITKSSHGYSY